MKLLSFQLKRIVYLYEDNNLKLNRSNDLTNAFRLI